MAFKAPELKSTPFGRGGGMGPKTMSLKTEGKPPPPKGPPGVRIENRIGVQAPAEVIWSAIYDLAAWAEWNPVYTKATGDIRIGQPLDLTLALPGQAPQALRPTVLEWVPNEQLHWRTSMSGGLVKSIHFLEIEPLSETGCIVSNGELISGFLARGYLRRNGRALNRAFIQMNEALKARAEALWAARTA
ncbi:SRPBCC family protein [Phenylobacterium sp.]|jgi:hypothetical protein|uniref:SRPBCC family protein n=1 Tax=Phenylobacterium sp. TaxID=1871053 RepID=UPI0037835E89